MKFNSILIVTYGRSGSTLLQGLLNSIDNVIIRGENYDFCWGLYQSWKSLMNAQREFGANRNVSSNKAWYGANELKPDKFIEHAKTIVKEQLVGSQEVCYGFKEIRYLFNLDDLHNYLDFLQRIFPNTAIIFNTRNHEDVVKSGFWPDRKENNLSKKLKLADKLFFIYAYKHKNSFIMKYEHMIEVKGIRRLFDFLGTKLNEEKVLSVLNTPHSYSQKSSTLKLAHEKRLLEPHKERSLPTDLVFDNKSKLHKLIKNSVVVISVLKNEVLRLPWFLSYYRKLGVEEFIFIDNGSSDGTIEYLLEQKDVILYHSQPDSYLQNKSGRLWINKLASKYAMHRWVLAVDVDELICWPNYKTEKLKGLTSNAERLGLLRIFTPMIDAYADTPVADLPAYSSGEPFDKHCKWIDPFQSIKARWTKNKNLFIYSGPRTRLHKDPSDPPPLMTKQTLYYVEENGYELLNSHVGSINQPSPIVAPLLHYKFLSDFSEKIDDAIAGRLQHWKGGIKYKKYKDDNYEHIIFKNESSIKITSGQDLRGYIQGITNIILKEF